MEQSVFAIFLVRIFFSVCGIIGNGVLIISILHLTQVKSFEVFLLGLAITNFGEILLVDMYDIIIQSVRYTHNWFCVVVKFLNICGENGSIFFTVLISIYRYQKIHNAAMSIISPIFMDRHDAAIGLSIACVLLAVFLGLPTYFINKDTPYLKNSTTEKCIADVFQCSENHCSTLNALYKYLFIIICHILPLIVVTVTSALIIRILFVQQKAVDAHHNLDSTNSAANPNHHYNHHHHHHHHHHHVFHRSTIGILAAMTLFQLYCILYLILHLVFSPYNFSGWSEMEFFITTLYTAIIPYIYGTGNNFFSLKNFMKT